jgi:hypothetical protein
MQGKSYKKSLIQIGIKMYNYLICSPKTNLDFIALLLKLA